MQISHAALLLTLAVAGAAAFGQAAPGAPGQPAGSSQLGRGAPTRGQGQPAGGEPPGAAAAVVNTPSSLLKPSLASVQDALSGLKMDRWKKGSVREEAGEHVASLLKDLQTNIPPLLTTADGAPGSVSQVLPLMKHLDAFYDVLLRVEEAARVSGPPEQVSALQQSMLQLNQSRLAMDDQIQTQAAAQEKQVADLQGALTTARADAQTRAAAATAAPVPCKPATPVKKKTTKKPAGTPPATPNGSAPGTSPAAKPGSAQPNGTTPGKPSAAQPKPN